jgi:hypothetical protein
VSEAKKFVGFAIGAFLAGMGLYWLVGWEGPLVLLGLYLMVRVMMFEFLGHIAFLLGASKRTPEERTRDALADLRQTMERARGP